MSSPVACVLLGRLTNNFLLTRRIQMLDAVRYLIVWNPVILIALHFLLHELGLDKGLQSTPDRLAGLNSSAVSNSSFAFTTDSRLNSTSSMLRLY